MIVVAVGVVLRDSVTTTQRFHAALAATDLAPGASGNATLTKTASGWQIELDASGLQRLDDGRFYEAWLKNGAGVLVPIGTFNEGHEVTLWAGVSPKEFTTLTVTRERADGDQTSSGEKVLVGTVDTTLLALALDRPDDLLPRAVEAAHHRSLANPERTRRLLVGEARDVDRDEDVAEVVGQRGDGGIDLIGLERGLGVARQRVLDEVELVRERLRPQPSALGTLLVQERVAQRAQQVAEVVLVPEQAWPREHARVRLLDEILGVLPRAGQRPCGPVEPVEMAAEPGGVERALHRAIAKGDRVVTTA